LQPRVEVGPEGSRPADHVLPKARLRLVDAQMDAAGERGSAIGGIYALLVDGVAGPVQGGEEGGVEAGADAHVPWPAEGYAERVRRPVLPAARPIVAERGGYELPEGLLHPLIESAPKRAVRPSAAARTIPAVPRLRSSNMGSRRDFVAPGS
jgi:hypothetical protein